MAYKVNLTYFKQSGKYYNVKKTIITTTHSPEFGTCRS